MNDNTIQSAGGGDVELVGVPTDLAERVGAVRLMRFALESVHAVEVPLIYFKASPDQPMFGARALLTTWTYALARGVWDVEQLKSRVEVQPDFRYLMSDRSVDAYTLAAFLELNLNLVRQALTGLLVASTGYSDLQVAPAAADRLSQAATGLHLAA